MRRRVCDTSCWKGPARLSIRVRRHVHSMLTLETKLYGVEFDGHGGGARGRRRVGLVIVAVGCPRLRCMAHATKACGGRWARVRPAGTDRGGMQGWRAFKRGVGGGGGGRSRGGLKGRAVVSLADEDGSGSRQSNPDVTVFSPCPGPPIRHRHSPEPRHCSLFDAIAANIASLSCCKRKLANAGTCPAVIPSRASPANLPWKVPQIRPRLTLTPPLLELSLRRSSDYLTPPYINQLKYLAKLLKVSDKLRLA